MVWGVARQVGRGTQIRELLNLSREMHGNARIYGKESLGPAMTHHSMSRSMWVWVQSSRRSVAEDCCKPIAFLRSPRTTVTCAFWDQNRDSTAGLTQLGEEEHPESRVSKGSFSPARSRSTGCETRHRNPPKPEFAQTGDVRRSCPYTALSSYRNETVWV